MDEGLSARTDLLLRLLEEVRLLFEVQLHAPDLLEQSEGFGLLRLERPLYHLEFGVDRGLLADVADEVEAVPELLLAGALLARRQLEPPLVHPHLLDPPARALDQFLHLVRRLLHFEDPRLEGSRLIAGACDLQIERLKLPEGRSGLFRHCASWWCEPRV